VSNPLLHFAGLPKFNEIKPEHVGHAVDTLIAEGRALVEQLATSIETPTWHNFAIKLEDHSEKLGRSWSQVGHMNAVVNSPALREAYNDNLAKLTDFYSDLSQDERLYAKFKSIQASAEFAKLTPTQQKIINNEVRDFKLGGAELPAEQKVRFKEVSEALSKLSSKFEENIMDNTNDFKYIVENVADLAGLPEDAIEAAKEAATADGKDGYQFSLHFPSYMPVLQYADNRALRETMYRAYATRASELSKPEWDNTTLIRDILKLKREEAQMLGFSNFAELSLATKMADSPKHVTEFLNTLAKRAKPYAQKDMQALTEYASKLGIADMQAWDVAYVSEKLRVEKYAFSDQEVKE
jgi:oligopeptidase A